MGERIWLTGAVLVVAALATACAPAPADPADAMLRESAPPWDAPRDAVSYIEAAGLPQYQRGTPPEVQHSAVVEVVYDGDQVVVPADIGVDKVRALEAAVHTHTDDGVVWVEGEEGGGTTYTLGQLFDLWGVRLTDECMADACGDLTVTVDGEPVEGGVRDVVLAEQATIRVDARR